MQFIIFIIFFFTSFSIFGKEFYIKKIEFHGLKNHSSEALINNIMNNRVKNNSDLLHFLAQLKIFDKIKIKINKNILNITVKEKPQINTIKYYGEDKDIVSDLLNRNNIIKGNLLEIGYLELFKCNLEDFLKLKQFTHFNLKIHLKKNKRNNINIIINLVKIAPLKIKNINFHGNKNFSAKKLLCAMELGSKQLFTWIYDFKIYSKSILDKDIQKIKDFYMNNGFMDFYIRDVKIYINKQLKSYILINVHEGPKYKIKNIIYQNEIDESKIDKINNFKNKFFKKNNTFSKKKLVKLQQKLTNFFKYKGFVNTKISYTTKYIGKGYLDIIYKYNKTKRLPIDNITFKGNYTISDVALRKYIYQFENNIAGNFNTGLIKKNITKAGYAKKITFDVKKNDKKPLETNILIKLKEKQKNKFITGLSYNRLHGIALNINTEIANFFGTGYDLVCKFHRTKNLLTINANYFIVNFFKNKIDINYNVYYKSEKIDRRSKSYNSLRSFGFIISNIFTISKHNKIHFTFGGDKTCIKIPAIKASTCAKKFIDKHGYKYKEYNLGLNYIYSSLDRVQNPQNGISWKINFKITVPPSNIRYYILDYDMQIYKQIQNECIISLQNVLAYGDVYGETNEFPFYKYFYLTGINNVRGFKDKSLGPKDAKSQAIGGNFLIHLKACLHFPFPISETKRFVKPYIFFDCGQIYNTDPNFSNKTPVMPKGYDVDSFLRCSAGISFHWATPIGAPIEFIFALPINPGRADKQEYVTVVMHNRHH